MRTLPRSAGTDVAAQCFLNALLRETKDWRYLPATDADALSEIHIPLSQTQALRVPVRYFSPTQHHQYRFPATRIQSNSDRGDAVTFPQLVDLILEKIFALLSFPATGLTINTYFISVTSQIHL